METVVTKFEQSYRKSAIPKVRSGDTVKVHQTVREGGKERVQLFEGTVIKVRRSNSLTASLTVRRLASGVGVEKTYLMHSPNLVKVQVVRRGKVRRNYLTYLRKRVGKATRLSEVGFDEGAVNVKDEPKPEPKAAAEAEPESKPSPTKTSAEVSGGQADSKQTKAEVKAETKAEDSKAEEKAAQPEQPKPTEDKAAAKKAKAEAFRKAQEAKK